MFNQRVHSVPNTDASVNKLAEISFNPTLTPEEKYREMVSRLLDPNKIDVLISGVVTDTGTVIQVRPMGVSKPDQVIRTKDRTFSSRGELFTEVNGSLALTNVGREEIKKAVKDLMESTTWSRPAASVDSNGNLGGVFSGWNQKRPAGRRQVYISHVSFMDGVTKTLLLSEEAALIDEAVKGGMQAAADTNPNIVINQSGHTVPNTDASVGMVAEISFNFNLTPEQKYREMVSRVLDPNKADVLISGVVMDTGTVIQIRPLAVSKPDEAIKSKDRTFASREELFTEVNGVLALTAKGREEIEKAVKDLIDNL